MKVNDNFYKSANDAVNKIVEEFENDLNSFKVLADEVLIENNFGMFSQIVMKSYSDNVYSAMSGMLTDLCAAMTAVTEDFINTVNGDDNF